MPAKKPKLYHLRWDEHIKYSAVIETDWTSDEIQAHTISAEYSGDEESRPIWQELIETQVLEPNDHVVGRELEYRGVVEASPLSITAENLPHDKKVALIDHLREMLVRKPDGAFREQVVDVFKHFGLDPFDPGSWGVIDRWGHWAVYKVSEEMAQDYWDTHTECWRLCSSITEDKSGDHYVVMDERETSTSSS